MYSISNDLNKTNLSFVLWFNFSVRNTILSVVRTSLLSAHATVEGTTRAAAAATVPRVRQYFRKTLLRGVIWAPSAGRISGGPAAEPSVRRRRAQITWYCHLSTKIVRDRRPVRTRRLSSRMINYGHGRWQTSTCIQQRRVNSWERRVDRTLVGTSEKKPVK